MASYASQERARVNEVLYKFEMTSNQSQIVTKYVLNRQRWLLNDEHERNRMFKGVGPMGLTINRLMSSAFYGKRTVKQPDEWNKYRQAYTRGEEIEEDGVLVYATANNMVFVPDWNKGNVNPH